ncbi:hypothetical protein LCGC14_1242930 [marine sediment metagenome]|uniref:Uncharacterized protein n=1 Tax=marine sediment metagenome TaxID=412755 RepID=A0A0F9L979_9ZZZZ
MRLTIPLTGNVLVEGSVHGDGALTGDDEDPIRPIEIDLGNVSWTMVDVDLGAEVMVIEVAPAEEVEEPTGEVDAEGEAVMHTRPTTPAEKQALLQHAQGLVMNHSKAELYQMTGNQRLRRPFADQEG